MAVPKNKNNKNKKKINKIKKSYINKIKFLTVCNNCKKYLNKLNHRICAACLKKQ